MREKMRQWVSFVVRCSLLNRYIPVDIARIRVDVCIDLCQVRVKPGNALRTRLVCFLLEVFVPLGLGYLPFHGISPIQATIIMRLVYRILSPLKARIIISYLIIITVTTKM
ncbi:hypothetical protein V1515DRAFT_291048 [Lipomyces mesembrius]